MARRKIAVIGIGKIAQDQHLPVIDSSPHFELAACVSRRGIGHRDVPVFETPAELYRRMPEVDLVAICTPPATHHTLVREAIDAEMEVLLEKPPVTGLGQWADLVAYGDEQGRILFQTWHSRYNTAVKAAKRILKKQGVASVRIDWREDVRKWHPGQDWVWEAGGFGVFDPGINALSILTEIMPFQVFVESASLKVPANRQTPVEAEIVFGSAGPRRPPISAGFNWLEQSGEIWTIAIETGTGSLLKLEKGGTVLVVDGEQEVAEPATEYEEIYERFAKLLRKGRSDMDGSPLELVADAFLLGRREPVDEFHW